MDVAPTKWPAPQIATVLPPLYVQSSQLSGTMRSIEGVPRRHLRVPIDFAGAASILRHFWAHIWRINFLRAIFLVLDTAGIYWNRLRNSRFLNFFQPKSNAVKTKMDRDQKLREDAQRIFKPFLARFRSCGWLKFQNSQSAASPEPCQKRLKNASRVFS